MCVCVDVRRTDEVMLAKFSSVWTLFSLAAFIVLSQCLAAPTSQRQDDGKAAAAAAAADPPLVRSMYSPHTLADSQVQRRPFRPFPSFPSPLPSFPFLSFPHLEVAPNSAKRFGGVLLAI